MFASWRNRYILVVLSPLLEGGAGVAMGTCEMSKTKLGKELLFEWEWVQLKAQIHA